MKTFIASILLFYSSFSFANAKVVGNGGEVIACRDLSGKLVSIELLDIFEARILRGQKMDLGGSQLSLNEKVEIALSRIARRDQGLSLIHI